MSSIELYTLLELVGALIDSDDPDSASARFRKYLRENVQQVGDVRAYVNDALARPGDQFNKALQDLINHIGQLIGFDVLCGRYRGVKGQIGFDGLWHSDTGWAMVVETKTTDVYTVKTSILLDYINSLVSDGRIKDPSKALGLYVYGRLDAQTNQLENAINAEGRQRQLRVVSVDALLNLLELKQEYELDHKTVLGLLSPAPVQVDPLVNLIFDIVSQEKREAVEAQVVTPTIESSAEKAPAHAYYLLPAADSEDSTPVIENLHRWLDKGLWGLGQRTGYRKDFTPGDHLCFYAARTGVVVEGTVMSPSFDLNPKENPSTVPVQYAVRLKNVRWLKDPVELSLEIRSQLSAFQGRDLNKGWAWFVQGTSKLTEEDFRLLTSEVGSQHKKTPAAKPVKRRTAPTLISLQDDYKGKTPQAIIFQGQRYEAHTWRDAMFTLFGILLHHNQQKFEETALTLVSRKQPYISRDKNVLRVPQPIPNTDSLYVETNLSANYIIKLCHTLIKRMGYAEADLTFETQKKE